MDFSNVEFWEVIGFDKYNNVLEEAKITPPSSLQKLGRCRRPRFNSPPNPLITAWIEETLFCFDCNLLEGEVRMQID